MGLLAGTWPMLKLRGHQVLPIVQGGMGVGVSAHRLAGSVAGCGAVGTLASVDLRRHHPDLLERGERSKRSDRKPEIEAANLEALDREIGLARELSGGQGLLAVNVMRAVSAYADYVKQACRSGIDAIVMGAGLPLDLPELTADHPDVALIPILSDLRGIQLVVKKWQRKGRLPDAIIVEHPRYAGGHLGAAKVEDLADPRFDFEQVIPAARAWFEEIGIGADAIPLIPAGGINSHEKVMAAFKLGAAAVQVGTPFAVTVEGDAHPVFKETLARAKPEDIVEFMSVAGLPARAVRTPWLDQYMKRAQVMMAKAGELKDKARRCTEAFDCLIQCGLRDSIGKFGQFCIDNHLAAALNGDLKRGLFFRGAGSLPFGEAIRPVRELIDYLLTGQQPADEKAQTP